MKNSNSIEEDNSEQFKDVDRKYREEHTDETNEMQKQHSQKKQSGNKHKE